MGTSDEIRLALPADPEYGRIARIAAAGLALRLGFSYREIEDLRLAVDEALILLLTAEPTDRTVTVTFEPSPERIVVEAGTTTDDAEPGLEPDRRERFATIVGPAVDEFSIDPERHQVRLVKRRHAS